MDSSVYTGNQKPSGPCSALAALGTLTYGPRVSDFPYTPRTHRLTYMYMYNTRRRRGLNLSLGTNPDNDTYVANTSPKHESIVKP